MMYLTFLVTLSTVFCFLGVRATSVLVGAKSGVAATIRMVSQVHTKLTIVALFTCITYVDPFTFLVGRNSSRPSVPVHRP